jgi:hypothetical protein
MAIWLLSAAWGEGRHFRPTVDRNIEVRFLIVSPLRGRHDIKGKLAYPLGWMDRYLENWGSLSRFFVSGLATLPNRFSHVYSTRGCCI